MDWLQFFSSVVASLAWPTSVVLIAFLLRGPLGKLLPLIRTFKYKDLEIDLGLRLEEAKEEVKATSDESVSVSEQPDSFRTLAEIDPRAAILSAWLPVERELEDLAKRAGIPIPRATMHLIRRLAGSNVLDSSLLNVLLSLNQIRNDAVHLTERHISYDHALEMSAMCDWALEKLRTIPLDSPPDQPELF